MSRDEGLIKGTLDTILQFAYPETYKDYLNYFVRIRPKELKSKHGHYIRKEQLIEIFNLSREPRFLLLTCIHEVAHHVEFEDLGTSDHEAPFYERFKQLYVTAVGLKLLKQEDLLEEEDALDAKHVSRYFGDILSWEIPEIPEINKRMVIVTDGRDFKQVLRVQKFQWFTLSHTWQKEFATLAEAEEAVQFLLRWGKKENFLIRPVFSPTFLAYYYIGVENGYDYRYGLKELGYLWEGYGVKKKWVKKVDAQCYYEELIKLTAFPGIEYKKVTPQLTEEKVEKQKAVYQKTSTGKNRINYYV